MSEDADKLPPGYVEESGFIVQIENMQFGSYGYSNSHDPLVLIFELPQHICQGSSNINAKRLS